MLSECPFLAVFPQHADDVSDAERVRPVLYNAFHVDKGMLIDEDGADLLL